LLALPCTYVGRYIFSIDATHSTAIGRFMNDGTGEERNCDIGIVEYMRVPHVCLFARKHIEEGEELRYDYGVADLPWRKLRQIRIFSLINNTTTGCEFSQ